MIGLHREGGCPRVAGCIPAPLHGTRMVPASAPVSALRRSGVSPLHMYMLSMKPTAILPLQDEVGWRAAGGERPVRSKANPFRLDAVMRLLAMREIQSSMECTPVILGSSGLTRLAGAACCRPATLKRAWTAKAMAGRHRVVGNRMVGRRSDVKQGSLTGG